jgi:tRNA1Val (adenine37-N6)-methyltransferase
MAVFRFKQFEVNQAANAMKVGTDSTILGATVQLDKVNDVLDVGAGTGVIALMIAQRSPAAIIDGIEIEAAGFEECRSNFEHSPWKDRLKAHHGAFQTYAPNKLYDLIVSNPPYFDIQTKAAQSKSRTTARQQTELTHISLIQNSLNLLKPDGKIALILPTVSGTRLMQFAMEQCGLYCHRQVEIFGKPTGEAKRIILELGRKHCPQPTKSKLVIELGERHHYTEEYLQLMRDFLFLEGNSKGR